MAGRREVRRVAVFALDTTVLVRYLAQDDARQSAAATRFIEERLGPAERGFVCLLTLLETVWLMESRYGADPALVAEILSDQLVSATLEVQDAGAVRAALKHYRKGGVDLQDCLIVGLAEQRKARVVTLNAEAARTLGMELLR